MGGGGEGVNALWIVDPAVDQGDAQHVKHGELVRVFKGGNLPPRGLAASGALRICVRDEPETAADSE